jgi:hypothetical protein
MPSVTVLEASVARKKAQKETAPPPPEPPKGLGRIELQAPLSWIDKLDKAADALGLSRSAFIRMACNLQMDRLGNKP